MSDGSLKLYSLIQELHRQYPTDSIHTWSHCTRCNNKPARGGVCADCIVNEIAELTGDDYAPRRYQVTVERQVELIKRMREQL